MRESGKREKRYSVCSKMCRLESIIYPFILCVFIPHYIRYAAATPSDDDDDEVVVRGAEESSTETRRQDVSLVFWCLD